MTQWVLGIATAVVVLLMSVCMVSFDAGSRIGACVELCRPLKFDRDQKVNGGCLCIGSDKVLRIKEAP